MVGNSINFLTGYVGLAGRPNVGKSSLMNQAIGKQVSIVTKRKQTTRNPVLGIFSSPDCQIAFLDNPGIDFKNSLLLNKRLKKIAFSNVAHTNLNIVMLEATKLLADDRKILQNMPNEIPLLIVLNKVDKIRNTQQKEAMYKMVAELEKFKPLEIIPISVKRNYQIDLLIKKIKQNLPVGEAPFKKTSITDRDLKFRVSEIIRKNIINCVGDEIHYHLAVEVTNIEEDPDLSFLRRIEATIYTSKSSHKPILIGERGRKLKIIRLRSTKELKNIFQGDVHLSLWVKLVSCWNKNSALLDNMGIS
ncbi:GTPase Era [Betaproteobacteria bacterium]|nr:GTPase Era [Betaproteobacteria bacterium]